jgi:aryl-alcohol dehydrogenase-like predicted oxidoreductase
VSTGHVSLGTNAFGGRATAEDSREVIAAALAHGITFIDTANIYTRGQSETIIGEALEGRRHEAVLATKAGLVAGPGPLDRGSSRHHLMRELEGSLRRLRTDYVDLYQIHTFDPWTPLEETLRTLDDMVRQGKARYVGASNYRAWELMKALGLSDRLGLERFISVQPSYSLGDRVPERELVPLCLDQGVGLIAYFPLAGGLLTGKYRSGEAPPPDSRAAKAPAFGERMLGNDARVALAQGVAALAQEIGAAPAQVALAWLIHKPAVATAIAGATRVSQVEENAGAAEIALDEAAMERLDALSAPFVSDMFDESRLPGA